MTKPIEERVLYVDELSGEAAFVVHDDAKAAHTKYLPISDMVEMLEAHPCRCVKPFTGIDKCHSCKDIDRLRSIEGTSK